MKTIKKSGLFTLLWIVPISLIAQNRNVAWVHGLQGSASSWEHYATLFDTERQINSLRSTYNTLNGVDYAANQVQSSMNSYYGAGSTHPKNLGIGHSMGGVMIRDVDRLTSAGNKKFGGLITVASPNYGAPIANSLLAGDVTNAAQNACNKITDGPLSEMFPLPWTIVNNFTTNVLCNKFIDNDLIQNLWGSPVTNADLKVGSSTINAINNYPTQIPRISIWAEETSPVHWRLFGSQSENNDGSLLPLISSARGTYHTFFVYNTALASVYAIIGWWNPWAWAAAALHAYRATQWIKGRNWIDDSETIWSSLIKTSRLEQHSYWIEVWVPCPYPPIGPAKAPGQNGEIVSPVLKLSPDPGCGQWVWMQVTYNVMVNYPSDGFLPQYTQELQNIPSGNRYKIMGANHVEVRDMSNSYLNGQPNDATKLKFNQIWDRQLGDFFRTDRK